VLSTLSQASELCSTIFKLSDLLQDTIGTLGYFGSVFAATLHALVILRTKRITPFT